MININSEMQVSFKPIDQFFDSLVRDSSEDKLFSVIKNSLAERGILSGFKLGVLGEHEEVSLVKNSDYWLVVFSERGVHHFLGIFYSYYEATIFFIAFLQKKKNEPIDWKDVFSQ